MPARLWDLGSFPHALMDRTYSHNKEDLDSLRDSFRPDVLSSDARDQSRGLEHAGPPPALHTTAPDWGPPQTVHLPLCSQSHQSASVSLILVLFPKHYMELKIVPR